MDRKTTRFVVLMLLAIGVTVTAAARAATDTETSQTVTEAEGHDKTLSPYFLVTNGELSAQHFPLKDTQVKVNISGVIADVRVTQRYVNEGSTPIHTRYVFPASTRAAVHGMQMKVGDRLVTARIKEREAAKKEFNEAKKAGKSAALLNQERPNVFTMNLANVMPGEAVEVELRYTELLVPVKGVYEFVYPTVVGPRYSSTPEAIAPETDQWVKSPYLHQSENPQTAFDIKVDVAAGMPLEEMFCPSHATQVVWQGADQARMVLDAQETAAGNRDFILKYRLAGSQIASGLLLHEGVDENFFLLMVEPPKAVVAAQIPAREYIFVVDISGSMHGFPLDVSKKVLRDLIGNLRPQDRFNVVLFAGSAQVLAAESLPATQDNIRRAIQVIDQQRGGGGTELEDALKRAMALPQVEGFSRSLLVVTDGYISADKSVMKSIRANLNHANVFAFGIGSSVNRYIIEGMAKAGMGEPFVVTREQDATPVASTFREYIESPVLTDIRVKFDGFETFDVEPQSIPDVFAQRPVLVYGKWRGKPQGTITLSGVSGGGEYKQVFKVSDIQPSSVNEPLRYLWARKRISLLSDFHSGSNEEEYRGEVVELGLKYNLLTRYTSFIAVDEVIRNPGGEGKTVDQPLPLPKGVTELAVGGGMVNTPEPEMFWLLLMVVGLLFKNQHCGRFSPIRIWKEWRRI